MASKEDLSEQLALTQKLAAQVERMAAAADKLDASYQTQIASVEKLAQAFSQINTQGTVQNIEALNTALQGVSDKMKNTGKVSESTFTKLGKKVEDTGKIFQKFPKSVAIGAAALSGFVQGFQNLVAVGKGVTGFFTSVIDSLTNIAASIIAIPFKMLEGLIDLAAKSGNGMNELAQEIENLRKQFGALYGPTNKAIIDTAKSLKGFSDTGLSAWRVFGNLANRFKELRELATEMGATFNKTRKEFEDNGGALLAYQKGLGLSNEQMKGLGIMAVATGQKMSKIAKDFTKFSYALADSDDDAKLLSRDMGKMATDVKHFGQLGAKELSEVAKYARGLGIEVDKMTSTLDKFESFDQAADSAAQLSQAFGVNIDAFKLMEAQNPADQFDMLRKAMFAAGKSADTMSRQELKLLAQQTGMDEQTAKLAFSMQNQGKSLEDIKKKSGDAEKRTLTQADAMGKLADAIERMVQSGGAQSGGFWDMFVKGFLGGIQASKEFRKVIWNIKRALQETYLQGVKLGKAFVEYFPGVKDFLQSIADFFKPEKFRKLVGGVVEVITDWMKDLNDPHGKASFASLMDKLKDKFFNFFDTEAPEGRKMLSSFKTILKTISKIMGEAIKWASDKIADGITYITDLITGKAKLPSVGAAAQGGLGFLSEVLAPILDGLSHAWTKIAPVLWELVKTLGKKLFDYLTSPDFLNLIKPAIPYMAAVLFGPAVGHALIAALTTSIAKGAGSLLTSGIKKAFGGLTEKAEAAAEAANKVPGKAGTEGMEKVGEVNKASGDAIKQGKGWGVKDAVSLGLKLVAIATALAIGGLEMSLAIVGMKKILDAGGIKNLEDVVAPLAVLGGMVLAAIPLMFAMKIASKVGSIGDVLKGGLIISVAVGIVGLVGAGLAYVLSQVGTPAELEAAGNIMLKMSLVFLAMVPLIFASMVIGALASGPQALALAAAAVGLGVIGIAVGEMAGIAVKIIEQLNKMRVNPGFKDKIDAFLGVMKAIQAFTDSLVKIIDLMQPSLLGFLTKTEEKFTDKINAARNLMAEMIGKSGQPGGIVGLVEVVMSQIKQLNVGGPALAESANTFAAVLTAVTEVMKALTPPDSFYETGGSFISRLSGPKPFADLATDVGYYSRVMGERLMEVLKGQDGKGGLIKVIQDLSSIEIPNAEKAKVVANLVSGLGAITKAITPDTETVKALSESGPQVSYAWGLLKAKGSDDGKAAKGIADIIAAKAEGIKQIMGAITTGPLASVIAAAGTIGVDKLEGVKALADIMKVVTDLTMGLANAQKSQTTATLDNGKLTEVTDNIPNLASVLISIGPALSLLMGSVIGIVKLVGVESKVAGFMKDLETTKTLLGFVTEIPKLTETLQKVTQNAATGGIAGSAVDAIMSSFNSVTGFLKSLTGTGNGTGSPLTNLTDAVKTISFMLSGKNDPDVMVKSFGGLSKTFEAVGKTGTNFTAMTTAITKATEDVKKGGLGPALDAVNNMVSMANNLNAALANGNLNKIDVKANLQQVAKSVGLGGKASYTVNPSKEVVITVNMTVTMDAGTVERVILQREGSILRDRLNFATYENPGQKATTPIPNNPDETVVTNSGGGTKT